MTIAAAMLFFFLVVMPISLLIAMIIVAVYSRSKPNVKTGKKVALTLVISFIICFLTAITLFIGAVFHSNNYWEFQGYYDSYRIPLEYPYQLSMIDVIDNARLSEWKQPNSGNYDVTGIKKIFKQDYLVMGQYEAGFFILDCQAKQILTFNDHAEYTQALQKIGFPEEPKLIDLKVFWDNFWSNEANWKNKKVPKK